MLPPGRKRYSDGNEPSTELTPTSSGYVELRSRKAARHDEARFHMLDNGDARARRHEDGRARADD